MEHLGWLDIAVNDVLASDQVLKQRMCPTPKGPIPFPRLTGLTASKKAVARGVKYGYSGGADVGHRETNAQRCLRRLMNSYLGAHFNATLFNAYGYCQEEETQGGPSIKAVCGDNSSIGRHSDDEKDMTHPLVVGISYIPSDADWWMIRFRSKKPITVPTTAQGATSRSKHKFVDVRLKHGVVYVMSGENFQREWTHEIPKSTKKWPHPGQRISLTFRQLDVRGTQGTKGGKGEKVMKRKYSLTK